MTLVCKSARIRFEAKELGTFTLADLFKAAEQGKVPRGAKFWSERCQSWRPLRCFGQDLNPRSLDHIKGNFANVQVLSHGVPKHCPACAALDGKIFPADSIPVLPPDECVCFPWCTNEWAPPY